MTDFELSSQAEVDLIEAYFYTLHAFGARQADAYVEGLKRVCLLLAETPLMGRVSKELRGNIRRHEHAAHVIFYSEMRPGKILVVRFLSTRQVPELHLGE